MSDQLKELERETKKQKEHQERLRQMELLGAYEGAKKAAYERAREKDNKHKRWENPFFYHSPPNSAHPPSGFYYQPQPRSVIEQAERIWMEMRQNELN